RRAFLGSMFSTLLARDLLDPGAAIAQEAKQIQLTVKHIQGFMAAYDHIAVLFRDATPDQTEQKLEVLDGTNPEKGDVARVHASRGVGRRVDEYRNDHVRHRPEDQEIHRAFRTDQERDRRAQGRQIRPGSGKERGPVAARGGAQRRKARSVQGKHRAGAKIFRQARAHYAGTRFEAATCGLEIQTGNRRTSDPRGRDGGVREKLAARVNRAGATERVRAVHHAWQPAARRRAEAAGACFAQSKMYAPNMMAVPRRRGTR